MIPLQFCSPEEYDIFQIMIYIMNNEQNNTDKNFNLIVNLCFALLLFIKQKLKMIFWVINYFLGVYNLLSYVNTLHMREFMSIFTSSEPKN